MPGRSTSGFTPTRRTMPLQNQEQKRGSEAFSESHERAKAAHIYFPASGQAVVTGVVSFPPRAFPSIFTAHRVQQLHCSSIFHRALQTHALSRFPQVDFCARKSPHEFIRVCTRGGFELTKLTYTWLEDNLMRHRGYRQLGHILLRTRYEEPLVGRSSVPCTIQRRVTTLR